MQTEPVLTTPRLKIKVSPFVITGRQVFSAGWWVEYNMLAAFSVWLLELFAWVLILACTRYIFLSVDTEGTLACHCGICAQPRHSGKTLQLLSQDCREYLIESMPLIWLCCFDACAQFWKG